MSCVNFYDFFRKIFEIRKSLLSLQSLSVKREVIDIILPM